ncbi:cation-translocating P-type ATPase [Christensenellaceae bacterium OttesenSCG-928-K19]|nr:cation-translocating P-type ATPase [Christensenellaceae bacterium OttesenSCG-928-K19]
MEDDQKTQVERFTPDNAQGLSSAQVEARVSQGLTNKYDNNKTKSYRQIFKDNLLTFFNILNVALAIFVITSGYYKDLAFLIVIVANTAIGIIQEINSKRTLDKLSLLVASKVPVIRDGVESEIFANNLVLDDVMRLKTGDQLAADGILTEGYLEVNESLLTGESDTVKKHPGDFLYSGSFVISGSAYARVDRVGEESFANKISTSAKAAKKRPSELRTAINKILRIVSIIVIPVGVLTFVRQYLLGMEYALNVSKTTASMIGMIPEGLFLITSISLATSAVYLAYKKTLVQDLYSIETLAYVDVLCLDKTGTITEGTMQVEEIIPVDPEVNVLLALSNLCGASKDENATISAIREYAGSKHDFSLLKEIPFSSARKYSGASFEKEGTYIIGAIEFVFAGREDDFPGLRKIADSYADQGSRVLVLAHSRQTPQEMEVPPDARPLCLIRIADRIRAEAPGTLEYFYSQDVDIKIISGDNPKTVSYVAQRAGVKNADNYIDASTLETDEQIAMAALQYSVFGRVTPDQKQKMLAALKRAGHTTAMTGDGVNDVLALKEADCSIAMASGSNAAKNISTLVLLDSNFANMPSVVSQGRRVINNIRRVATLFITKTIYSVLLALFSLFLFSSGYPFSTVQLTLISFVTIGFPAFFLALEPNNAPIKGSFLVDVFARSLPGALCVIVSILIINAISAFIPYSMQEISTMSMILAVAAGMVVVARVSMPFTRFRIGIFAASLGLFVACMVWPWARSFFNIAMLQWHQWLVIIAIICVMPLIMRFVARAFQTLAAKYEKKYGKKPEPFSGDFVQGGKDFLQDKLQQATKKLPHKEKEDKN